MLEIWRKTFHKIAETLEVLMAVAVFAAVLLAIASLLPTFREYAASPTGSEGFMHLLEQILSIVVGLEFVSMLCKPDAENVTEVLIFLIARHVIVLETSSVENLLSVISIAILFFIRYFLIQSGGKQPGRRRFPGFRLSAGTEERSDRTEAGTDPSDEGGNSDPDC